MKLHKSAADKVNHNSETSPLTPVVTSPAKAKFSAAPTSVLAATASATAAAAAAASAAAANTTPASTWHHSRLLPPLPFQQDSVSLSTACAQQLRARMCLSAANAAAATTATAATAATAAAPAASSAAATVSKPAFAEHKSSEQKPLPAFSHGRGRMRNRLSFRYKTQGAFAQQEEQKQLMSKVHDTTAAKAAPAATIADEAHSYGDISASISFLLERGYTPHQIKQLCSGDAPKELHSLLSSLKDNGYSCITHYESAALPERDSAPVAAAAASAAAGASAPAVAATLCDEQQDGAHAAAAAATAAAVAAAPDFPFYRSYQHSREILGRLKQLRIDAPKQMELRSNLHSQQHLPELHHVSQGVPNQLYRRFYPTQEDYSSSRTDEERPSRLSSPDLWSAPESPKVLPGLQTVPQALDPIAAAKDAAKAAAQKTIANPALGLSMLLPKDVPTALAVRSSSGVEILEEAVQSMGDFYYLFCRYEGTHKMPSRALVRLYSSFYDDGQKKAQIYWPEYSGRNFLRTLRQATLRSSPQASALQELGSRIKAQLQALQELQERSAHAFVDANLEQLKALNGVICPEIRASDYIAWCERNSALVSPFIFSCAQMYLLGSFNAPQLGLKLSLLQSNMWKSALQSSEQNASPLLWLTLSMEFALYCSCENDYLHLNTLSETELESSKKQGFREAQYKSYIFRYLYDLLFALRDSPESLEALRYLVPNSLSLSFARLYQSIMPTQENKIEWEVEQRQLWQKRFLELLQPRKMKLYKKLPLIKQFYALRQLFLWQRMGLMCGALPDECMRLNLSDDKAALAIIEDPEGANAYLSLGLKQRLQMMRKNKQVTSPSPSRILGTLPLLYMPPLPGEWTNSFLWNISLFGVVNREREFLYGSKSPQDLSTQFWPQLPSAPESLHSQVRPNSNYSELSSKILTCSEHFKRMFSWWTSQSLDNGKELLKHALSCYPPLFASNVKHKASSFQDYLRAWEQKLSLVHDTSGASISETEELALGELLDNEFTGHYEELSADQNIPQQQNFYAGLELKGPFTLEHDLTRNKKALYGYELRELALRYNMCFARRSPMHLALLLRQRHNLPLFFMQEKLLTAPHQYMPLLSMNFASLQSLQLASLSVCGLRPRLSAYYTNSTCSWAYRLLRELYPMLPENYQENMFTRHSRNFLRHLNASAVQKRAKKLRLKSQANYRQRQKLKMRSTSTAPGQELQPHAATSASANASTSVSDSTCNISASIAAAEEAQDLSVAYKLDAGADADDAVADNTCKDHKDDQEKDCIKESSSFLDLMGHIDMSMQLTAMVELYFSLLRLHGLLYEERCVLQRTPVESGSFALQLTLLHQCLLPRSDAKLVYTTIKCDGNLLCLHLYFLRYNLLQKSDNMHGIVKFFRKGERSNTGNLTHRKDKEFNLSSALDAFSQQLFATKSKEELDDEEEDCKDHLLSQWSSTRAKRQFKALKQLRKELPNFDRQLQISQDRAMRYVQRQQELSSAAADAAAAAQSAAPDAVHKFVSELSHLQKQHSSLRELKSGSYKVREAQGRGKSKIDFSDLIADSFLERVCGKDSGEGMDYKHLTQELSAQSITSDFCISYLEFYVRQFLNTNEKSLYSHLWGMSPECLRLGPASKDEVKDLYLFHRRRLHPELSGYSGNIDFFLACAVFQGFSSLNHSLFSPQTRSKEQKPSSASTGEGVVPSIMPSLELFLYVLEALESQEALIYQCECDHQTLVFNPYLNIEPLNEQVCWHCHTDLLP